MPRSLVVAFLACNKNPARHAQDASWLYRCDNLAEALARAGHAVHRSHVSRCPARHFDLVVLHRPLLGWRLRRQLAAWRRAGTRVLADFDDLVFEPALAAESPGVLNGQASPAEIAGRFSAHRAVLAEVDGLTVSTTPLAEELRAVLRAQGLSTPVAWLPNAVHHRWRGLPCTALSHGPPCLSYLSGTHSHDLDFAEAAEGLSRLLRAQPGLRLEITGRGHFALDAPAAQWRQQPRQPFATGYADTVRRARVNLMPLQPTRFNRCKSALKVIEAGYWQVPTLCSPLPDADRFADAGATRVEGPEAWFDAAARLCLDESAWRTASHGLRERVLALADAGAIAADWRDFVHRELGL